jgi:hypothetical protein
MRSSQDKIVERVRRMDFGDDTLVDIRIHPPRRPRRGSESSVEIDLRDEKLRHLRFSGCANLRIAMDFDVLADNLHFNTDSISAHTKADEMRKFIQRGDLDNNVEYSPEMPSPVRTKIKNLDSLIVFRITFFGGTIDVLARNVQVKLAR